MGSSAGLGTITFEIIVLSLAPDIAIHGALAPHGPSFRGQRVSYKVEGDTDMDDVAFDKGDSNYSIAIRRPCTR